MLADLVRVASATVGTGTLTLGSAITGFLTPTQAGMLDGRIYSYAIEADYVTVGDDLVPTSREIGKGTYTASGGTLTRTVLKSTNSNALLNLAGDEQVLITPLTQDFLQAVLSDITFYVAPGGSDSNPGTSASPFATIQHAVNVGASFNYQNLYKLIIQVADGTVNDTGATAIFLPNIPSTNPNEDPIVPNCRIIGNETTPTNVVCNTFFFHENGSSWFVSGFSFRGTDSAHTVGAYAVPVFDFTDFGGNFSNAAIVSYGGFISGYLGTFTISSSMNCFLFAGLGSPSSLFDFDSSTITFLNSPGPDFASAFVDLNNAGFEFSGAAFVNASIVTGVKGRLNNYCFLDLAGSTADGNPLKRSNFPGTLNFLFSKGESFISSDPCLFVDLPSAVASEGLRQNISDATASTWNANTGGGGQFPALVIAMGGEWKIAVVGDAGVPIYTGINIAVNSGSASAGTTVDAPAGSAVVLCVLNQSVDPAHTNSIVDSVGNTYTKTIETSGGGGTQFNCSLWHCFNVLHLPVGTTFTATTSTGQYCIGAAYMANHNAGVDATGLDSTGNGTSAAVAYSGSNTSDIAFVVFNPSGANGTFTIGDSFYNFVPGASNAGQGCFGQKALKDLFSGTWAPSWVTSIHYTAAIALYKKS